MTKEEFKDELLDLLARAYDGNKNVSSIIDIEQVMDIIYPPKHSHDSTELMMDNFLFSVGIVSKGETEFEFRTWTHSEGFGLISSENDLEILKAIVIKHTESYGMGQGKITLIKGLEDIASLKEYDMIESTMIITLTNEEKFIDSVRGLKLTERGKCYYGNV